MIYACEQKRPEVIKQREEWVQFVESVNPEKLVFLDESGVNTDFTRKKQSNRSYSTKYAKKSLQSV